MELQQQRMPYSGIYGSHYDNPNAGFPGQGRHPLSGGYPFPPMPGQNYTGYPHLGYPSSQSPNPREGKLSVISVDSNSCVCRHSLSNYVLFISGCFDYFAKFAYTQDIFCLLIISNGAGVILCLGRAWRDSQPGPESKPLIPKWRLFAITAILPIIHSAGSLAPVWHARCTGQPHLWPGCRANVFIRHSGSKIVAKIAPKNR